MVNLELMLQPHREPKLAQHGLELRRDEIEKGVIRCGIGTNGGQTCLGRFSKLSAGCRGGRWSHKGSTVMVTFTIITIMITTGVGVVAIMGVLR